MRRPSQVRSVTDLLVSSERVDAIAIIVFLCDGESCRSAQLSVFGFMILLIVRRELPPSELNDEECGRIKN